MPYKDKLAAKQAKKWYYENHRAEAIERATTWARNNRDRRKQIARDFYHRHKIARQALLKSYRRFRLTGWLPEEYQEAFEAQEGRCAICNVHQSSLNEALNADHNHTTQKRRGLVCGACNRVLGVFKDDPKRFHSAAEYLEKFDA